MLIFPIWGGGGKSPEIRNNPRIFVHYHRSKLIEKLRETVSKILLNNINIYLSKILITPKLGGGVSVDILYLCTTFYAYYDHSCR